MKKIALIVFAIFCFSNMYAQEKVSFGLTLNHVALSVKDLNNSADFYQNVFGLKEIINRTKKDGIRWFSLGEDKELHLLAVVPGEIKTNKAVHFALTSSNFDEFIKSLNTSHIKYFNWDGEEHTITTRADGIKQVYLQDPDSYWIEVNSAQMK